MKKLLVAMSACLSVIACVAQKNCMPDKSEFIRNVPAGPANEMFTFIDQRGLVAYKGRDCDDYEGTGFVEGDNGKKYGSNQWIDVHIKVQHYKPAGKLTFDNIMQYNPPAKELSGKEASYKAEPADGYLSRKISVSDVTNGKMLVIKDVSPCVQSKYDKYTTVFIISYAVIGTTIVWMDANYYSDDITLAVKIHNDIVEKITKGGIE
jgi:hypothetical protein